MAGTSERAKKLKESRERAKEISKTKDKAPFSPSQTNTKSGVGSKIRKETRPTPTSTKINQALTPSRTSPGSKVRKESRDAKTTTVVKKTTVKADPAKKTIKKGSPKGQAGKGASPLEGKPRSIAAARKAGEKYFFDSKGVKKLAVTGAELKKKGMTLKQWANSFAKKKQTKKHAESLKGFAATKKRAGGMMKKKGMARGGMMMKKKGMAAGGKLKMVEKDGKKVPFFAADGKGKMRGGGMMKKKMMKGGGKVTVVGKDGKLREMDKKKYDLIKSMRSAPPKPVSAKKAGGMMKKKGYAMGGAMKKKGYKKGGKVLKMRGGGLATRGMNFTIK